MNKVYTLSFPEAQNVVVSGDIHGEKDVEEERSTMTELYDRLVYDAHPLEHWYYGHFHQSWHSSIKGVLFKMLDIMEFTPINY